VRLRHIEKGEKQMRRLTLSVSLLALLVPRFVAAEPDFPRCDERLIQGSYGFTIEGEKLGGPGPVGAQAGVALITFDGQGNMTVIATVTIGGVLFSDFDRAPATGTYTVNADCTGSYTHLLADGHTTVTDNFVIAANGDEIYAVVIPTPPSTAGVLATRSIGKRTFTHSR
jgi:hypothetical protein